MTRHQTGPPSITIKCSNGASNDPMSPYSTEYSARIGIGQNKEHGAEKRNRATGYKSNFRPGVYYSTKLDRIDNDPMIGILNDSYVSETAKCFADPVQKRSSNNSLPINLSQKGSGFTRLRYKTTPLSDHKLANESEVRKNYLGYQPDRMSLSDKKVGAKVYRSHAYDYTTDPIEYKPLDAFAHNPTSWQKVNRKMDCSENTVEFTTKRLNGGESITKTNNSKHDYSRQTTKPPYLHGDEETATFNGVRLPNRFTTQMEKFKYIPHTERETFALKESANAVKCSTGCTQNNDRFVPGTNRDAQRFLSHYDHHFKRPERPGQKQPATRQCDNGFTKSTRDYKLQLNNDYDASMPPWKSADFYRTRLEKDKCILSNPAPFDETRNYKMNPQ